MSAEIINLRKARKAAARQVDERAAEANRRKFGEAKAPKAVRKAEEKRAKAAFEAGRLAPGPEKP